MTAPSEQPLSQPRKAAVSYQPDPKEVAFLEAAGRFQLLTSKQFVRYLRYSAASEKWVGKRLARLVTHGYLVSRRLRGQPRDGGTFPLFYGLGATGHALLVSLGMLSGRFRGDAFGEYSPMHVEHTLAANNVVITASLIDQYMTATLASFLTESELKRQPRRIKLTDGSSATVSPDAYLEFRLTNRRGDRFRQRVIIEVDMGTEHQDRWRGKVRRLLAGYSQERSLAIAVLAARKTVRAAQLRSWTLAELTELGRSADADLFLFGSADPATTPPDELFLTPRFIPTWSQTAEPLIAAVEGE